MSILTIDTQMALCLHARVDKIYFGAGFSVFGFGSMRNRIDKFSDFEKETKMLDKFINFSILGNAELTYRFLKESER